MKLAVYCIITAVFFLPISANALPLHRYLEVRQELTEYPNGTAKFANTAYMAAVRDTISAFLMVNNNRIDFSPTLSACLPDLESNSIHMVEHSLQSEIQRFRREGRLESMLNVDAGAIAALGYTHIFPCD